MFTYVIGSTKTTTKLGWQGLSTHSCTSVGTITAPCLWSSEANALHRSNKKKGILEGFQACRIYLPSEKKGKSFFAPCHMRETIGNAKSRDGFNVLGIIEDTGIPNKNKDAYQHWDHTAINAGVCMIMVTWSSCMVGVLSMTTMTTTKSKMMTMRAVWRHHGLMNREKARSFKWKEISCKQCCFLCCVFTCSEMHPERSPRAANWLRSGFNPAESPILTPPGRSWGSSSSADEMVPPGELECSYVAFPRNPAPCDTFFRDLAHRAISWKRHESLEEAGKIQMPPKCLMVFSQRDKIPHKTRAI